VTRTRLGAIELTVLMTDGADIEAHVLLVALGIETSSSSDYLTATRSSGSRDRSDHRG
jgi:hypothetical protein